MSGYTAADAKRDDLMTDAVEEVELDDLYNAHGEHDGDMRNSECPRCEQDLADAMAEYAWMATAVKAEYTRDEREAMEADRELMASEFHR